VKKNFRYPDFCKTPAKGSYRTHKQIFYTTLNPANGGIENSSTIGRGRKAVVRVRLINGSPLIAAVV
jgi:hypothetical protein